MDQCVVPFRIDGLSVGDVGISSADAIGNVYHLTNIEDFSDHYLAVSAGALLAGGGDVATMRNQHGVVIDLTDTSQGAKIMLAVQGVKITLEGAPTASKGAVAEDYGASRGGIKPYNGSGGRARTPGVC